MKSPWLSLTAGAECRYTHMMSVKPELKKNKPNNLSFIFLQLKVKVKVAQSCLTLCDPMDYTVHGILQARILEWVAFPFSRGSSQSRD